MGLFIPSFVELNMILKNISSKDLTDILQKYMNPDKFNIVLVGDKKKILPGLTKLGYKIVEVDSSGKNIK